MRRLNHAGVHRGGIGALIVARAAFADSPFCRAGIDSSQRARGCWFASVRYVRQGYPAIAEAEVALVPADTPRTTQAGRHRCRNPGVSPAAGERDERAVHRSSSALANPSAPLVGHGIDHIDTIPIAERATSDCGYFCHRRRSSLRVMDEAVAEVTHEAVVPAGSGSNSPFGSSCPGQWSPALMLPYENLNRRTASNGGARSGNT